MLTWDVCVLWPYMVATAYNLEVNRLLPYEHQLALALSVLALEAEYD